MKRLIIAASALILGLAASAQPRSRTVEMPIWENGAPTDNCLTAEQIKQFEGFKGGLAATDKPVLHVHPAANPNGTAILMCPGGAYIGWAGTHEGNDMASWMNSMGITFAVLHYRMPNGHKEVPLSDAEQAMKTLKERATEWGIDPEKIGVMGASAGGHLAASLATLYSSEQTRPAFQILFYPVITMKEGLTHQGSRENLLGKDASKEDEEKYSLENHVNAKTPKAFIMLSADDDTVPAENSIAYSQALIANKVPVAMFMYPTGGHGWGYRDDFKYKRQWTGELEKWLRETVLLD